MPKANQRAQWERSGKKTEAPSRRTAPKGLANKLSEKPHEHFTLGDTGCIPRGSGQTDLSILKR